MSKVEELRAEIEDSRKRLADPNTSETFKKFLETWIELSQMVISLDESIPEAEPEEQATAETGWIN